MSKDWKGTLSTSTEEALASEPGETTGAGTTDDPFTAVELPPVNHPDVDIAKDSGVLSFIEYEVAVLERHPDLLTAIEKYSNEEENSMIERTTAAIEIAGIVHYPHRIGISSTQLKAQWYETKVSQACGAMNIWGKQKLHSAIVEHQLAGVKGGGEGVEEPKDGTAGTPPGLAEAGGQPRQAP